MDVVYRYRRAGSGEELRYSLRSLQNIPHNNVWIVGDTQPWLKNVNVIPVPQVGGRTKWDNSRKNVIAACKTSGVSDDFIMMDDDFYIMHEMSEIPVYHRGVLEEILARYKQRNISSRYVIGLRETAELLYWAGCSEPLYAYNLHVPMVINKEKMLECLAYVLALKPKTVPQCFHLRSWYGNFWQLDGERVSDVKVYRVQDKIPNGSFLSTSNTSFNRNPQVRKLLKEKFSLPSPYERGKDGPHFYKCPRIGSWT